MSTGNHPNGNEGDGEPHFAARLFPHRSLSPGGFTIVMAFVGVTSFAAGMMFLMMGAWPVVGFFGLDAFLVWLAFRANYRSGRAFEEVAVWPHDLLVRQVSPAGKVVEHRFNPFFARFFVDRHDEIGITRMRLAGGGSQVDIGSFLNPGDRESFAAAFAEALSSVRR